MIVVYYIYVHIRIAVCLLDAFVVLLFSFFKQLLTCCFKYAAAGALLEAARESNKKVWNPNDSAAQRVNFLAYFFLLVNCLIIISASSFYWFCCASSVG